MQDQLSVIAEADQQPPANKSAPANGAAGHHAPRDPLMKSGPAARVLTTRQLASLAPQKWHIDSIIPKGVVGDAWPDVGESFVAIDMAQSLAAGTDGRDSELSASFVGELDDQRCWRSSSTSKKWAARRRISFARFSSRFS
jgi:hypothetical protein